MSTNANFGWVSTTQKNSNVDLVSNVCHMLKTHCGHMVVYLMCYLGGHWGQWEAVSEQHTTSPLVVYGGIGKTLIVFNASRCTLQYG